MKNTENLIEGKVTWKPGTMIYPLPVILAGCGNSEKGDYNLITAAWTGIICTNPSMCYISVRPERHSYDLIKRDGAYTINLTTEELVKATDWCGVKSGRDFDKFRETGLTAIEGTRICSPIVKESPVNIECEVREIRELGSHHMFISDIVAVHADKEHLNPVTGAFDLSRANPICYSHGKYYSLDKKLGFFGFSVMKKKKKKKKRL